MSSCHVSAAEEAAFYRRRLLHALHESFPSPQAAKTELVNLTAIESLPCGSYQFVSDLHGEHVMFSHLLRSCSGLISSKIAECFDMSLSAEEQRVLASVIYFPDIKLPILLASIHRTADRHSFYRVLAYRMVLVARAVSSKYTRSKLRKALPPEFAYIMQELILPNEVESDRRMYYATILDSLIESGLIDDFVCSLAAVIRRLSVDILYVLGDIFDRGDGAPQIVDALQELPTNKCRIVFGNHEAPIIAAASGCLLGIATWLRITFRYNNNPTLRNYGLDLLPLALFASKTYPVPEGADPKEAFKVFWPKKVAPVAALPKPSPTGAGQDDGPLPKQFSPTPANATLSSGPGLDMSLPWALSSGAQSGPHTAAAAQRAKAAPAPAAAGPHAG
jgi:fructose-1,6-bisphosphatase-3